MWSAIQIDSGTQYGKLGLLIPEPLHCPMTVLGRPLAPMPWAEPLGTLLRIQLGSGWLQSYITHDSVYSWRTMMWVLPPRVLQCIDLRKVYVQLGGVLPWLCHPGKGSYGFRPQIGLPWPHLWTACFPGDSFLNSTWAERTAVVHRRTCSSAMATMESGGESLPWNVKCHSSRQAAMGYC